MTKCKKAKINIIEMQSRIKNIKLHVLTFATHEQGYFKTLQESCKKLNIDLIVLGMGNKWEGFISKLINVKEYLKKCNDKDIILFVDGFDTIFIQPSNVIIERYILNYDNFFVCTSESAYSSNIFLLRFIENMHLIFHDSIFKCNYNTKWDSINIKDKYSKFIYFYKNLNLLNSGGWISNVFLAKQILRYIPSFIENDQIFLTNLYLDCEFLANFPKKDTNDNNNSIVETQNDKHENDNNKNYYSKIILDNHNIIFHLFRKQNSIILLNYADCVNFFPFKPILRIYYDEENVEKKNGEIIEKEKLAVSSHTCSRKDKSTLYFIISFFKNIWNKTDENIGKIERTLKKIQILKNNNKNKIECLNQNTILDNIYMGNTNRKICQIEKTFNYSMIDTQTHTSPCILHIHCLRNIDNIILNVGLKNIYNYHWYSNIWYLFYSLKGTINFNYFSLLFSTIVVFVTFFLINMKYIIKLYIYMNKNILIDYMQKNEYFDNILFFLNDIEMSCFASFILACLFWIFYALNKSM
ncbi:procollagen lysine 5-dioxygenase, putative [Plasmodium berghei]|uniref:Procollagen lysine 5-dioxygenase, putative n=2 Tax=Plasmodium berghei TaxID=5821 RepID=A0A509AKX0_PLABA|nr:procollagen lysine 5-dioxygenase, putative [Plasmodium berghei ANKA]CXI36082.1 procollagen lysine 5-dioxygenase, putative [Plasmodium berghei]SCM21560.1 procollagen lysine 5-dioxygenase, putative [Plasmodium berghei]SCN24762.1 procollagen lysine 5-dioxygenase, putative [Plasmodium berghei]SCO59895.1 procollagen lysine 5-dioxygenase, putative [Plasmodium berghei]SCO61227.1 procollagen lysine 5-dioxygenase, putative [Plasmodium berghei]|eukprot:XP_034421281.1 procollagen lysine 5-dioxygenase, putative [Plasmodium berghei ANKA]